MGSKHVALYPGETQLPSFVPFRDVHVAVPTLPYGKLPRSLFTLESVG